MDPIHLPDRIATAGVEEMAAKIVEPDDPRTWEGGALMLYEFWRIS